MRLKLDEIDCRIVELLQENGRMPSAEIARRLGNVTERLVRGRIENLVRREVIQVSAIVNCHVIDRGVIADVWIEAEPQATAALAERLLQLEEVSYLANSTGEHNISLQVRTATIAEFHRVVTDVIGKMPGIISTTATIVPIILKDIHQWKIPQSVVTDR